MLHDMLRAIVAVLASIAVAATARAQVSLGAGQDSYGAVTPASMAARAEASAQEFRQQFPGRGVARTVAFDAAWPLADEDTGGYVVLLIAAQSHTDAELPMRRLYVRGADGRETELQYAGGERASAAADSLAAAVFGQFQEYAFYWAPAEALLQPGELLADFATGRTGFRVATLPLNSPPDWRRQAPAAGPNVAALTEVRAREFPGFAPTQGANR
jgi:hypothetical protein